MLSHLSFWLHPATTDEEPFRAEIGRLSTRWDAPPFPPHVTLLGGFDAHEHDTRRRGAALAAELTSVDVEFTTLDCEEPLHRSLFLGAAPNAALDTAFETAVRVCGGLVDPQPFRPHLSLAYLDTTLERKRLAAASVGLTLPIRTRFTTLALWRTPMPQVRDWRKVGEWTL